MWHLHLLRRSHSGEKLPDASGHVRPARSDGSLPMERPLMVERVRSARQADRSVEWRHFERVCGEMQSLAIVRLVTRSIHDRLQLQLLSTCAFSVLVRTGRENRCGTTASPRRLFAWQPENSSAPSVELQHDMFAVPGWSVPADSLKTEKAPAGGGTDAARCKKRKRAGTSTSEPVTAANVVDLYEAVVEGKKRKDKKTLKRDQPSKRSETAPTTSKGSKAGKADVKRDAKARHPRSEAEGDTKQKKDVGKQKQKEKPKRKSQDAAPHDDAESKAPAPESRSQAPALAPASAKTTKLTPLQASMKEKLVSARFRHLNETLYTRPSDEAFRLFDESPEMFDDYHQGFRRQVKVWPENPVDSFLQDIRSRARAKTPSIGRARPGNPPAKRSGDPLPRTAGTCTIADLGCGDARLAESLQAEKLKLRLKLLSYDLCSSSSLVTRADIAHLPLEDGSVNVAIFCLALMGTNWIDFIEEAYRILHWKGELWVAEIKSRFGPVRRAHNPVHHSVGNNRKRPAAAKAARGAEQDADDAQDLAVQVDGADDRSHRTDVSAFVEVLRHRGFVLRGEPNEAVDLSNRMFVKMHFVKAAAPTRGKGAKAQEAAVKATKDAVAKRWLGDGQGDNAEDANEAAILKPCVYKTR
ncbi:hypothetical protein XA68_16210 [Ophiocordyceps unilateralis]|uniref:Ribosomal RNA-processing protein 8 n=1 Tax=Ophiocordyceps unilateralis TaxID=268505 RepID=A0A2A9P6Z1_OPHUN|nr:hypothetical protein XA68_16210 [Ophiocordyceps unilateralis]